MYPIRRITALLLIGAVSTIGCAEDTNQDPAGASELLERVRAEQYRTWLRAPGNERRSPGTGPHGGQIDVYVNTVISGALAAGGHIEAWPPGSITVKDGFQGAVQTITAVMEKRSDGWFYAEYDAAGTPTSSGRPAVCTGCHSEGSDFIRSFTLPQ